MGNITLLLATGITSLMLAFNGSNHYSNDIEVSKHNTAMQSDTCLLADLTYIDENDEIELGFDTAVYLPEDYNAYEGMTFDISEIEYAEIEQNIELGFDTKEYLPEDFNAYAEVELNLDDIIYIEDEEEDFEHGLDASVYVQ
ncbi:hypothetical protein [Eudoraea chungangensis]|uniref:hypothetical protein n=1 Tax=Eudoraea chungangensis TaxID=1481905 RepID=UPI0023EE05CF|nr:hypothetical protein [Eudoraea chungangensis]